MGVFSPSDFESESPEYLKNVQKPAGKTSAGDNEPNAIMIIAMR